MAASDRAKAGTGKTAAADRRKLFVQHYLGNGHNATQAAKAAGFSPKTASSQGQRLLKNVEISGQLAEAAQDTAVVVGLETQRTLLEVARIAYSDLRKFYDSEGAMLPMSEWTDDMAACVASCKTEEKIENGRLVGYVREIKLWDKNVATSQAMKHHGLFERHNVQRQPNVNLQINIVGSPPVEDGVFNKTCSC
jgi:phage terminase small subunit